MPRSASRRWLVPCVILAIPTVVEAQLVPGRHTIIPSFGVAFSNANLLVSRTPIGFGVQPLPDAENEAANPVDTEISLDPGFSLGLRYSYNMTRRLAVELDGNFGVSVLVVQMLEELPEPTTEPQYETTAMDARMYRYGFNLAYHMGNWQWFHPFLLGGVGGQVMDLRQKGEIKTDSIRDVTYMLGFGGYFHANDRLAIRAEVRDYIYNFHFDNQFAGDDSWRIIAFRDIGRAVAVSQPERQHDVLLTLGFQIKVH